MNLLYTFIWVLLSYSSQNKSILVKCVSTHLKVQNDGTSFNSFPEYPNDLKIITKGSSEPNDTTKYDFRKSESDECHYILKQGSHCTEVKAGQVSIWKGKPGDKYPSAISCSSNEIAINFSDNLLVFENKNGSWQSVDRKSKSTSSSQYSGSSKLTESSPLKFTDSTTPQLEPGPHILPETTSNISSPLPQPTRFNLDEHPDLKRRVVSLTKFQLLDIVGILLSHLTTLNPTYNFKPVLNNYLETSISNKHPVTLNIDMRTDTSKIHVSNDSGSINFTTQDNYAIKLVKKGEMIIWHTLNTREYLTRVDINDQNLVLYDLKGTKKQVPIEPIKEVKDLKVGVMTEPKTSALPKLVSIDVTYKKDGAEFQYQRNENKGLDVYYPIKPYLINKITNNTRTLWEAIGDNYCISVFVRRNSEGKTVIGLDFVDEDDEVIVDADQEPELNMVTLDLNHKKPTQFIKYSSDGSNKNHLFAPIAPHLITRVKIDEVDLWKLDPESFHGHPEFVKLQNNESKVTIKLDEISIVYVKNETGKWVEEQISCCECNWKCVITFGLYSVCKDKCSK